ncbi:MAG: TolC family protein [Chitinophagales bacterium]
MIKPRPCHQLYSGYAMLLTIVFIMTGTNGFAQLNIDTCQAKAKANYPLIKQYDLIAKSLEYTISNANKAYLPQVSLNAIGAYIISGFPSVNIPGQEPTEPEKFQFIGIGQINQAIWDGGATHAQKEIAKASTEVDKANTDLAFYNIRERVNQLYFGILVIDEQLKQLYILNENLDRNLDKVKLSKDNGLAYQSDVDEVKAEILNTEQKKIEFNFTRKGYVEMLSFMTGVPLNENVKIEKPPVIESYAALINNRAELGWYARQQELIGARSTMDKVYNMPKVGFLAAGVLIEPGMDFASTKINSLAVAGLSVSWNTAGIYKSSNNKQLSKIQLDRISNQQEAFLFTNSLQLKQAASEIEKQKAILSKDDEIVLLKGNIKKSYQLKYDNGMCPMNDLIDAISKESEARSNQSLHNVQLLMSMYNYKTISGN